MSQSKNNSVKESILNCVISFLSSMLVVYMYNKLFSTNIDLIHNIYISLTITFLSLLRYYIIRRIFNAGKS